MKKSSFYTITFGLLAFFGIGCAIAFNFMLAEERSSSSGDMYKIQLSNHYQQAMYNVSESFDNMDSNLSKILVSDSPSVQAGLIAKLEGESDAANIALCALPINTSDTMIKATKFVNQTSGYAKSLSAKLASGSKLTYNDKETIKSLKSVAHKLSDALNDLLSKAESMDTMELLTGDISSGVDFDVIVTFDEGTFDYPKMIYDGPFSDSMEKDVKSTSGKITKEQASDILNELWSEHKDLKVTYVNTITNNIEVYVFDVSYSNQMLRVDITNDGRVAQINGYNDNSKVKISRQDAISSCEAFAAKLGYNVKAVWVSKSIDSCIYVNLCPVVNDVIMYPDLIKMCVDDSGIVSLEAYSYLSSHKERDVNRIFNVETGLSKLDDSFEVTKLNIAMVPINNKEILCYEYEVTAYGNQYFIYLDADTFEEVQILQIISGSEGYTVM